jgi:hypothetical protein
MNDRISYGPSFAIRAAEQTQYRYDPNLGAAPGENRYCEEAELIRSLLKANYSGWWVPGAEVKQSQHRGKPSGMFWNAIIAWETLGPTCKKTAGVGHFLEYPY